MKSRWEVWRSWRECRDTFGPLVIAGGFVWLGSSALDKAQSQYEILCSQRFPSVERYLASGGCAPLRLGLPFALIGLGGFCLMLCLFHFFAASTRDQEKLEIQRRAALQAGKQREEQQ
jgi:hypothetical protein